MNGAPLPLANGAPVRLASPIKFGCKQSKWVTGLERMTCLGERMSTWEDRATSGSPGSEGPPLLRA
ncbi:MAG: molybdopterin-dependent oxidoreductase [Cyanobium sp. CZS 25K]|nr:molybdopterin-dependent oxidoreductase [Cyanobium sp. CZS25K]